MMIIKWLLMLEAWHMTGFIKIKLDRLKYKKDNHTNILNILKIDFIIKLNDV